MKQFGVILDFEIKNYLKNKVFVGITLVLVVGIALVVFWPRISESLGTEEPVPVEKETLVLCETTPGLVDYVRDSLSATLSDYELVVEEYDKDALVERVQTGEIAGAIVLDSLTSFTYYVYNLSLYDVTETTVSAVLRNVNQLIAMMSSGMSAEEAAAAMNIEVNATTTNLGVDQADNFLYTYLMIMVLYLVILLYGQMVASDVASEKSSRAMEVLVTSAKPSAMMYGKVLASCGAGLLQLVAIFGTAILCYRLNAAYWEDNYLVNSLFNIPPELLVYMLIFFLLGFLVYAFMYAAVGSVVSKLEDISTMVMPITMMFVVALVVVVFSLGEGDISNSLMVVCSYIPFTSPMAMFTRIAMSTVPFVEIALSLAILVLSVVAAAVCATKIYRAGVLLYGTKPNIATLVKIMKNA